MTIEQKILDVMKGMEGIGGIPTPGEYFAEFDMRVRAALGIAEKSVVVITNPPTREVYANLRTACNHYGWVYNTLCRRGDRFMIDDSILVERLPIIRKSDAETN